MSNASAKVKRSKAKDKRQMPAPDMVKPRRSKKKSKPFIVKYKWKKPFIFEWSKDWHTLGRYRSEDDAKRVMVLHEQKWPDIYELELIYPKTKEVKI